MERSIQAPSTRQIKGIPGKVGDPLPQKQRPTPDAENAVRTVTVLLKHPNGLILNLYDMVDDTSPRGPAAMSGPLKIARKRMGPGTEVRLNGCAEGRGSDPRPNHLIVGGYGVTPNVSKDFWDKWYEDNKDSDLVRNKIIWAMDNHNDATSWAKEHEGVKSGFEPLDPNNLPRNLNTRNLKLGSADENK